MLTVFHRLSGGLKSSFGLAPKAASKVPAEAPPGTRFLEVQRRIRIYLRAMWDCEFVLKQTDIEFAQEEGANRPFIEDGLIHLPSSIGDYAVDGVTHAGGLEIYRAAATHAAAHLMYSREPFSAKSLDKVQITLISAIEDARVEALASRSFPGLQRLWARQHTAIPQQDSNAGAYLRRLARSLLDPAYRDDDPWIAEARALFATADLADQRIARAIGVQLADSLRRKKVSPDLTAPDIPYRDDNRLLWNHRSKPVEIINPYRSSRVLARDGKPTSPHKKRKPLRKRQDDEASAQTFFYPEWNYRSQTSDPGWVTLHERETRPGEIQVIDKIVADNQHLVKRMRRLLQGIRDGAVHRIHKLEDGDEVDLNAAIRAQIDLRLGLQPDARIMMRTTRKKRDISVLLLMDLSGSMTNKVQGQEHTALELAQQVGVLFSEAVQTVGDPFAIHGFSSASRHNVEYYRLKDFDENYDDAPKARLAGMASQLGTRMGAAIRHAAHHLNQQKSEKKLLIVISDGAPADVDVTDHHYLLADAKKVVDDAARNGIHTYCINFDPSADFYVTRIFGARNYMVVDHVRHLPEKILLLYAALTR
jgi:nitric oxide reductase NorD protein